MSSRNRNQKHYHYNKHKQHTQSPTQTHNNTNTSNTTSTHIHKTNTDTGTGLATPTSTPVSITPGYHLQLQLQDIHIQGEQADTEAESDSGVASAASGTATAEMHVSETLPLPLHTAPFLHSLLGGQVVQVQGGGSSNTEPPPLDRICRSVIRDMDNYGLCVLDNFLGRQRGEAVLEEVMCMYNTGLFKDGQLVSSTRRRDLKTIRGDQITWIDGKEPKCENIAHLIHQVDSIIMRANKMSENGKLGCYNINGRTKAMVACYPGSGSHYVKHVDNPNKDGRCITAIYYLNLNWNVKSCGGLLRIFPEGWRDQVADIEPLFDRVLFFWSDRRNPHEVQPAFDTRYAITLWYFDAAEREEACRRYQRAEANRVCDVTM